MKKVLVMMAVGIAIGSGCVCDAAAGRAPSATSAAIRASSAPGPVDDPALVAQLANQTSESPDERQIRGVLDAQVAAWNRGDIDEFMKYYWRSEKTLFVGANGVTRGWQAVLDRYHRAYPNQKVMGQLTFSNIEIEQDCALAAVIIGEYHLHREKDNPSGVFTLNFRRFPEGWRITVDHTTAFSDARAIHK
ncbi:MAG TPA: nuclear transport factor 2 family protein [Candidatus Acidoferrum sp.]|nr:nuclear transport factor 2 family protein [Candidatus Acidoferrum sp.]